MIQRIYSLAGENEIAPNKGVVQLLFFEGEPCETTYPDRGGNYQDRGYGVTLPKV